MSSRRTPALQAVPRVEFFGGTDREACKGEQVLAELARPPELADLGADTIQSDDVQRHALKAGAVTTSF